MAIYLFFKLIYFLTIVIVLGKVNDKKRTA